MEETLAGAGMQLPSRVVVGLSGGADSTALLLVLYYLAPRLGISVEAAHLDHAIRERSADDVDHCRALAEALGLAFYAERVNVPSMAYALGQGLEEAGRTARLEFLGRLAPDEARGKAGGGLACLGHQLDDLAEDVLMRLTRGAGWPALAGMPAFDPKRRLLRPLLLCPRADIEAFLHAAGATWLDDPSNRDQAFFRNRVRRDILPLFVAENPGFLETVAGLWRLGRLDAELFAAALPEASDFAPRAELEALAPALRLRLYKACVEALGPGQPLLANLRALEAAFVEKRTGAAVQFPGAKTATVEREGVRFRRD